MDMLDSPQQIKQHDSQGIIHRIGNEPRQLLHSYTINNIPNKRPAIKQIVVTGVGDSVLAGRMVRDWLDLTVPFEVVKDYSVPRYVNSNTLVIICSLSNINEEMVSTLDDARQKNAHIVIVTGEGVLLDSVKNHNIPYVILSHDDTAMCLLVPTVVRALLDILVSFHIANAMILDEITVAATHLASIDSQWGITIPIKHNLAKQLAWRCAGKTPIFYTGNRLRSCAYTWKNAINQLAKNTAWYSECSDYNHAECMGWSSHPIDKPFAVFNIRSNFDHPRIAHLFTLSERFLSGKKPQATDIVLQGDTIIEQLLWNMILADYTSAYLGVLNGVDPAITTLKDRFNGILAQS